MNLTDLEDFLVDKDSLNSLIAGAMESGMVTGFCSWFVISFRFIYSML